MRREEYFSSEKELFQRVDTILKEEKAESFGGINVVINNKLQQIIYPDGTKKKMSEEEKNDNERMNFPPQVKWKKYTKKECEKCSVNKNRKCLVFQSKGFNYENCDVLMNRKKAYIK